MHDAHLTMQVEYQGLLPGKRGEENERRPKGLVIHHLF
jgi:hypothetical protein